MTIYYHLTFLLLASEMVTFCVLVAPLPHTIRKGLFKVLTGSVIVAKVAYVLKISFVFVAILFFDALQRMFRINAEVLAAKQHPGHAGADLRVETNIAAKKFYAQRNVYLTGFCLFLSLVLTRTFYILLDLIHTQDQLTLLQKTAGKGGKDEVDQLKAKIQALEGNEIQMEVLKKQTKQQQQEYNRLATELNKATGSKSDKRKD